MNVENERLLKTFDATEEDLSANRAGRLTDRQCQRLRRDRLVWLRIACAAAAMAALLATHVAYSMFFGVSTGQERFATAFIVCSYASIPLLAAALFVIVRKRDLDQLPRERVTVFEGRAHVEPAGYKQPYPLVTFGGSEDGLPFLSEVRSKLFVDGNAYRVYILGKNEWLAAEALPPSWQPRANACKKNRILNGIRSD